MISKMSANYPVMQILGYQKIDPHRNLLINEPESLTIYPKTGAQATARANTAAAPKPPNSGQKPRLHTSQTGARRPLRGSKRSTNMTSYCDVNNPTRHLEPNLEGCKVSEYKWRFYDDVPSPSSSEPSERPINLQEQQPKPNSALTQ